MKTIINIDLDVDVDLEKLRRQCRDALNKTSNKTIILTIANLLNVRISQIKD